MLQVSDLDQQLDRMSQQLDLIMQQAKLTNVELHHQGEQLDTIINGISQTNEKVTVATATMKIESKLKDIAVGTLVGASIGVIVLSPLGIIPGLIAGTSFGFITSIGLILNSNK